MFDQVFWRAIAGQVNRWRRKTLGLASTHLDEMEPHKIPFLYNFSPTVVPQPLDWPDWIRITGYWFLDDAEVGSEKWQPPSELVSFIDNAHELGKKVVYIGFGSIVVSDPKTMTKTVIDAILRSGVHAILSKGWSDRLQAKGTDIEPEAPLPKQVYPLKSVPHDWLFQRIDAACHHGGAGTTGASLRGQWSIIVILTYPHLDLQLVFLPSSSLSLAISSSGQIAWRLWELAQASASSPSSISLTLSFRLQLTISKSRGPAQLARRYVRRVNP